MSLAPLGMNRSMQITGICLLAGALPLALRLVWEMTWLTWHDGPQMVGFSMAHVFPLVLLVGAAAWLGLAIWIFAAVIMCFRKRTIGWADALLLGLSIFTCASTFIPQPAWSTATEFVLGLSPQAPNLLIEAARQGQVARVQYLLTRGVSPNPISGNCSPLAAAASSKSQETVRLLLDHHADPNGVCGSPALMNAIEKDNLAAVRLLVSAGAKTSVRDKEGFTPYDQALFSQNKELIHYLESQGITK